MRERIDNLLDQSAGEAPMSFLASAEATEDDDFLNEEPTDYGVNDLAYGLVAMIARR
jgi:hypothetical protein